MMHVKFAAPMSVRGEQSSQGGETNALLAWAFPCHVLPLTIYPKEKRTTPKIVEIQRHQLLRLLKKESADDVEVVKPLASIVKQTNYSPEQLYQQLYPLDYLPSNELAGSLNSFPLELGAPFQLVSTRPPSQHSHFPGNYILPSLTPYGLVFHHSLPPMHNHHVENTEDYANGMHQRQNFAVQSLNFGYYTQTPEQGQQKLDGVIYNLPVATVYTNTHRPYEFTSGVKSKYGQQPSSPVYHYHPVPKGTYQGQPTSDGRIRSDVVPINHEDVNPTTTHKPIESEAPPSFSSRDNEEDNERIKYDFGYRVVDEGIGLEFGKTEMKKNGLTQGSYHVLLPDGRLQVVKYWSDHTGYHTDISYSRKGEN